MNRIKILGIFIFLILFSHISIGINKNTPNPTGGFGNTANGNIKINPNPTGGFGPVNSVPQTLGPPPPPPDPTPLDPGVVILIVATMALGFKKLYNHTKLKEVSVK